MLSRLDKLKAILTRHKETSEKIQVNEKPESVEPKKAVFIYPVALRSREKACSVKLLEGFITENPGDVRARGCVFCRETPRLLAVNYANPCLALFGCQKADCNNKLIRVDTA